MVKSFQQFLTESEASTNTTIVADSDESNIVGRGCRTDLGKDGQGKYHHVATRKPLVEEEEFTMDEKLERLKDRRAE